MDRIAENQRLAGVDRTAGGSPKVADRSGEPEFKKLKKKSNSSNG